MSKKAFTMIELIITIVILGIVSAIGAGIIKFSYDNQRKVEAFNALELKSQAAIDFLTTHLNNSIKNSFRLKKDFDTNCKTNTSDCKFVFNIKDEELGNNYNIFEWARIAVLDKRKDIWDGISLTKCLTDKTKTSFVDDTTKIGYNKKYISGCFSATGNYGIYFLGDNIANTTTFIETDLLGYYNKEIYFDKSLKNFTVSNAYVLVDNIERIIYDKNNKILKFYSEPFEDFLKNNTNDKNEILVDNVESIKISNINGVTKIELCLKIDGLPGSYFSNTTSITACKTGVIL